MDKEKMEIRAIGEVRSTDESGVLESYLTKWDSIDSYQSTFTRGAFKKTFEERGTKIKLLWDHDNLIGHVLEAREDNYGPWIKAQLNLETNAGRDAYAHLRAGDVDAMSFGFNVIQDKVINNVRTISEVRVLEVSPVLFPANEQAKIVSVRAEDFNETVTEAEIMSRGYMLMNALNETIQEIWWNTPDVTKIEMAIDAFKIAYVAWSEEYMTMGQRSVPTENMLSRALYEFSKGDLNKLAMETSFTIPELKRMAGGRPLELKSRNKLAELPDSIRAIHHNERSKAVQSLCSELQAGGLDEQEMKQLRTLLENKEPNTDISEMVSSIRKLRTGLIKEK